MTIDWNHFTPWSSLTGGVLLGISASLFILINGRVLGISGILGGLLVPKKGDAEWRIAFLLGLAVAPLIFRVMVPPDLFHAPRIDATYPYVVVAGLLVGLGTRYGSGCTSGHGVCGLSRMSPRSLLATITFMAFGFLTVFVLHHLF